MDFYIYDDEEFFASDFRNEELQTILDALRKEVKGEILYEMERLKKENEYLKAELEYSKKLRAVVQARKNQQQKKK